MSHLPFLTVAPDSPSTMAGKSAPISTVDASSQLRSIPPRSASTNRIPSLVRFPLAVIIALGSSAGLYSVAAELTGYELSTVSRSLDEPWQILALVGWRVAELYIYWASGFDHWDVASLTVLTLTPYHSLLSFFYSISPLSVAISVAIDLLSSVLPFALLRPQAPYNDPPPSAPASTELSTALSINFMVSLFLTVTYAVTIFACLQSFLPSYIVSQFDIRTLEPVRSTTFLILLGVLIPVGNAAKSFLYVPSTYLAKAAIEEREFDAQTATLPETLAWNLGLSGWGKREDVLLRRTLLLAALTMGASVAKIFGTVEGAELTGALGWGGVWAATGLLAGTGLGYVGDA